ncbi:MAG: heme A synthase [Gammaproteobacteria bacterium]|nr:heme A synthase [Gammaproteobacteria bacterium]MYD76264.1 heme A synthase [Gammaproteobacteria bacterium]MYJ53144.1 heme A synthase [Gammaproteobacteria bacterium]
MTSPFEFVKRSRVSNPRGHDGIRIAAWLCVCSLTVFSLILLGGAVRLTGSGLSMVDWRPFTGLLPPLSNAEWLEAFERYRQFPEFRKVNYGMDLAGFKFIFLMEYAHRVLARLAGMVFLIPFLCFLLMRKIDAALIPRLWGLFVLGAVQGVIGWYMVKSGLVDNPAVSQYRLTLHLLVAVVIYAYMIRLITGLLSPVRPVSAPGRVDRFGTVSIVFVLVMIASGGMMAGTHAGFIFNTFPTMGGEWIPGQLLALEPVWLNLSENPVAIQFVHRVLALAVAVIVILYSHAVYRRNRGIDRLMSLLMIVMLASQLTLGIAALVNVVPTALGVAHQAGAMLLLTSVLIARYYRCPVLPRA